jgi:hypothetical protein
MRKAEAEQLCQAILKAEIPIKGVLEVGASSKTYRNIIKPHIEYIYRDFFRKKNASIKTVDIKADEGVDFVGDLLDNLFVQQIDTDGLNCIAVNNLLEHVSDIKKLCKNLSIVDHDYIIYSGPLNYPYHRDPIDNLERPNKQRLKELFPDHNVKFYTEVCTGDYMEDLKNFNVIVRLKKIFREVLIVLYLIASNRSIFRFSRLAYLFKSYSSSIAILQKK